MASLESLSNPLERTGVLPQGMNANSDPATGSLEWDVARQYFKNDVATSAIDGGAYIYSGTTTTYRGGTDPSTDANNWTKTFPNGVSFYDGLASTFTNDGAGGFTYGAPATNVFLAPAGSEWLCVVQGTWTCGAPTTDAEIVSLVITGNGVGGTAQTIDCEPRIGSATTRFGVSAVVKVGTGGTNITLTGTYAGANQNGALQTTFVRLF